MIDFIKALYQAIIDAFTAKVPEDGEKADLFADIKKIFDDFFAGLKA